MSDWGLSTHPTREQERQEHLRVLEEGAKSERLKAIKALAGFGGEAQTPLCEALKDPDLDVAVAAAKALGKSGDEGAIPALAEALRSSQAGGSAQRQRLTGLLLFLLGGLLVCGTILILAQFKALGALWIGMSLAWHPVKSVFERRKRRGQLARAAAGALIGIGERAPTPQLNSVVGELKLIAGDALQQTPATRKTSRKAAARIERLTEHLKSLPVASEAAAAPVETLPVPSTQSEPPQESLPRVVVR